MEHSEKEIQEVKDYLFNSLSDEQLQTIKEWIAHIKKWDKPQVSDWMIIKSEFIYGTVNGYDKPARLLLGHV